MILKSFNLWLLLLVALQPILAFGQLTAEAEVNSPEEQRDLALSLLNRGRPAEAFLWFCKGAAGGDLSSTFYCGKMLMEGLGTEENTAGGLEYMRKAAAGGFPQAMHYIATCYEQGRGEAKNEEEAIAWYELAADKGAANAQWELAQRYRTGTGVDRDFDKALYWYAACSVNGYENRVGILMADSIPDSDFVRYMRGMKDYYDKDYACAMKIFKSLGKGKIKDAKIMEAVIMANPDYSKYNLKRAMKRLKGLAKSNARALYELGMLYMATDMEKAAYYILKAAEKGYAPAECVLGDIYYEGKGVEKDPETAMHWYGKAYEHGLLSEEALKRYGEMPDRRYRPVSVEKFVSCHRE